MKLYYLRRAIVLTLAVVFVLSMIGCGSRSQKGTETSSEIKTGDKTEAGSSAQGGTDLSGEELQPWGKYSETVTLARAQMTFSGSQWENGDTAENNPWTRAAKETFNIDLVDAWSADGSQYGNKINLSIASKTLPDVFWVDSSQFAQVVKSGLIADLTDVYETTASPEMKDLMMADQEAFDSGKADGKLMGISTQHFGVISQLSCVWIRDDWMKNLNLSAPKTMGDLINIADQFTHNDPDGNGQDDTYGLAVDKDLGGVKSLMAAYHAYPAFNTWLKDGSGALVSGSIQPEVKTALAAFQDMYKKGILSSDFAVKDSAKVTEDIVSGKVGICIAGGSFGYYPGIDVIKNNGEKAIFKPYLIPSADDQRVKQAVSWPVGNYIVVSKDCKNPEAAIKMVNLYIKIINEGTVEDYNTYVNNERSWGAIPFQVQNPDADYNQYVAISAAQDSRDTSNLKPDQLAKYNKVIDWIDNKNPDSVGQYLQVSKEGSYSVLKSVVDNKDYIRTAYRGVATPTMVQKESSLNALEDETFTKIIMGDPIDSFDTMVEKWKSLGGDDITREMNEAYGE